MGDSDPLRRLIETAEARDLRDILSDETIEIGGIADRSYVSTRGDYVPQASADGYHQPLTSDFETLFRNPEEHALPILFKGPDPAAIIEAIHAEAAAAATPVISINGAQTLRQGDVLGYRQVTGEEIEWNDGVLLKVAAMAMDGPLTLLVRDAHEIESEAFYDGLVRLLMSGDSPIDTGADVTVERPRDTLEQADPTNITCIFVADSDSLNDSDGDRDLFDLAGRTVTVPYMENDRTVSVLLSETSLPEHAADMFAAAIDELRLAEERNDTALTSSDVTLGTSDLVRWATLADVLNKRTDESTHAPAEAALQVLCTPTASEEAKHIVTKSVKSIVRPSFRDEPEPMMLTCQECDWHALEDEAPEKVKVFLMCPECGGDLWSTETEQPHT